MVLCAGACAVAASALLPRVWRRAGGSYLYSGAYRLPADGVSAVYAQQFDYTQQCVRSIDSRSAYSSGNPNCDRTRTVVFAGECSLGAASTSCTRMSRARVCVESANNTIANDVGSRQPPSTAGAPCAVELPTSALAVSRAGSSTCTGIHRYWVALHHSPGTQGTAAKPSSYAHDMAQGLF